MQYYKPYQDIITQTDGTNQELEIFGTVYLRVQANPNSLFYFSINSDEPGSEIYLDRTGCYEIDLRGLSIINKLYLKNIEENQQILIDTLREITISS